MSTSKSDTEGYKKKKTLNSTLIQRRTNEPLASCRTKAGAGMLGRSGREPVRPLLAPKNHSGGGGEQDPDRTLTRKAHRKEGG